MSFGVPIVGSSFALLERAFKFSQVALVVETKGYILNTACQKNENLGY